MRTRPDILILCGSQHRPSYTFSLAYAVADVLERGGARVRLVDLGSTELPLGGAPLGRAPQGQAPQGQAQDPRGTAVRELAARADAADAMVLASPVYHNSYSGLLKGALDLLDPAPFEGKPVGLISHGDYRTTQAVDHLRIVARGLGAVAIPTQLCTARSDFTAAPGADGIFAVIAPEIRARIERFAAELLRFVILLRGAAPAVAAAAVGEAAP